MTLFHQSPRLHRHRQHDRRRLVRTLDELDRRIREAIELCLEVEGFPEQNPGS